MYIRALQGKEEALGPDHTSTLSTVNNLGNLYADQGKLAEAEKMYIRALQGKEEALGPDHTSTLDTVNNLGPLYADQGKLAEAEKMYHSGAARQGGGTWSRPHIDTRYSQQPRRTLRGPRQAGRGGEDVSRALRGYEKHLVRAYVDTRTVNNLGDLYSDQGKLDEAEKMFQRALQGDERHSVRTIRRRSTRSITQGTST